MEKASAGLLMYRRTDQGVEVFLVHPGGPFWAKKDKGVWTIPKGRPDPGEGLLPAAEREFQEETGFAARGPYLALGEITQGGGKVVTAWAFAGDCDPAELKSNVCEVEWPPRSGKRITIPEIDRGAWFGLELAAESILRAQQPLLERLRETLAAG